MIQTRHCWTRSVGLLHRYCIASLLLFRFSLLTRSRHQPDAGPTRPAKSSSAKAPAKAATVDKKGRVVKRRKKSDDEDDGDDLDGPYESSFVVDGIEFDEGKRAFGVAPDVIRLEIIAPETCDLCSHLWSCLADAGGVKRSNILEGRRKRAAAAKAVYKGMDDGDDDEGSEVDDDDDDDGDDDDGQSRSAADPSFRLCKLSVSVVLCIRRETKRQACKEDWSYARLGCVQKQS